MALFLVLARQAFAANVTLSWVDNSTDETGFKIERATGTTFATIATVGANEQSYVDSTAVAGSSYCYRIKAYNSAGESSPSNQACINIPSEDTSSGFLRLVWLGLLGRLVVFRRRRIRLRIRPLPLCHCPPTGATTALA